MFFNDIKSGERTSDIRLDDRRFAVGDIIELNEWDPVTSKYTGNTQDVEITYIQGGKSHMCALSRDALKDEYLVLSIKLLNDTTLS